MRVLEAIFHSYLDEVENKPYEEEAEENGQAKSIAQALNVQEKDVYLMFEGHIPIYYVIFEAFEDGTYEVLKATTWIALANHEDLIVEINDEMLAVEVWNNFYIREEDIKKSVFIGQISNRDMEIIKKYKSGLIEELPLPKRGLYAVNPTSYQQLFHKKESEIVEKRKLKIL